LALLVLSPLYPSLAHADIGDARLYLDLSGNLLSDSRAPITLRPMLRTEQRFARGGLTFLKISTGLRMDIRPWLRLQSYYAHIDQVSANHHDLHMGVFDVILRHRFDWLGTQVRVGNEWHATNDFYRLRLLACLHFDVGLSWLRPYVSDEVRFNSDQARLNMQESVAGLDFKVSSALQMKLFYNLILTHHGHPGWHRNHVVGLVFAIRT